MAFIIDYIIVTILFGSIFIYFLAHFEITYPKIFDEGVVDSFLVLSILFIYFALVPYFWNGYTIGKRLLSIKIINPSNPEEKVPLLKLLLRSLFIVLLSFNIKLLIVISLILIFLHEDRKAIHDFIVSTEVVQLDTSFSPIT